MSGGKLSELITAPVTLLVVEHVLSRIGVKVEPQGVDKKAFKRGADCWRYLQGRRCFLLGLGPSLGCVASGVRCCGAFVPGALARLGVQRLW